MNSESRDPLHKVLNIAYRQGNAVTAMRKANSRDRHPLSPAERTAKLLAFKPNFSHNFTTARVELVPVKFASGAFRTS